MHFRWSEYIFQAVSRRTAIIVFCFISDVSKMNIAWHAKHPMPKHPSIEQRIKWHLAHAKHCACREIPPKLKLEMKKRGIEIHEK